MGRESEIAELRHLLLDGRARLLTVVGTGGSGKTRLAVEVASTLLDDYPDGLWFVELAPLSDPELVPQAVASTLGVREESGRPLTATLIDYLRPLRALLVLDNCEHLAAACATLIGELLHACHALQIMATSRQALNLEYERVWRVPPLSTPPADVGEPHPDGLERYEAARLFVERAAYIAPDFSLSAETAPAVAELCRRLDGIPLAIELAAVRVRVLSPEQIVDRLGERFRLLTGGRSSLPRQQTLSALIDWSYDLLSEPERTLLNTLAVFAGGFSLEAAQAVWSDRNGGYDVIDLLGNLADRSLVMVDEHGRKARYRLLETIREYALDKLQASGREEEAREAHSRWFLAIAEDSQVELLTARQGEWLDLLETEHDNLRAALVWCRDTSGQLVNAVRMAGALVWFWYFRGYLSEGRGWLEGVLALPGAGDDPVEHAKALSSAGALAYLQSDYPAARERLEQALSIWRPLHDLRGTAFSLAFLGQVAARAGDPSGVELCREGVAVFRELGDTWGLALALDFLGEMAWQRGDDAQAGELYSESLALYRKLGEKWGVALELSNFGRVALRRGDYAAARERLQEALALQREVGDKWLAGWTLLNLGDVARLQGDVSLAGRLYGESLQLFQKLGNSWGMGAALHLLAILASFKGDLAQAESLYFDSLALFRELGDRRVSALTLFSLGEVACRSGEFAQAAARFLESLVTAREAGEGATSPSAIQFNWLGIVPQHAEGPAPAGMAPVADCLQGLAVEALSAGFSERGVTLLAAANATAPGDGGEGREAKKLEDAARQALGARAYEAARATGRAMSVEDALAYALGRGDTSTAPGAGKPPATTEYPDDLTPREVEVLRLVANGLTDQQVAERLVLSARTVQAHLRSIYSKLDIAGRSAATRYAVEHGLI